MTEQEGSSEVITISFYTYTAMTSVIHKYCFYMKMKKKLN